VLAAFIATNLESVIGATLQAKVGWLTNGSEYFKYIDRCDRSRATGVGMAMV